MYLITSEVISFFHCCCLLDATCSVKSQIIMDGCILPPLLVVKHSDDDFVDFVIHRVLWWEHGVRKTFRKMAGPDSITGQVLMAWADQLAPMFTKILNLSPEHSVNPYMLQKTHYCSSPKETPAHLPQWLLHSSPGLSFYETLWMTHQRLHYLFTTWHPRLHPNHSTKDAITHHLHTDLSHLDSWKGNFQMWFVV